MPFKKVQNAYVNVNWEDFAEFEILKITFVFWMTDILPTTALSLSHVGISDSLFKKPD